MKRLPVTAHLSADAVGQRYRRCPDPKEKTRWHLVWLLLQDQTLTYERAGPLVGLSDTHARTALKRWNATGPDALTDGRKTTRGAGKLTAAQQAEAFDALQTGPPDGGLWSGPRLARYVRDRWGVEARPATGWRWLRKLGFRLVGPRPRHPKAANADDQRRWL
jgi:transposase